ncbi:MAG: carboxypeptidase regulatory-like domain-containing protein [Candidatus Schekmanbacteria bacterium]|nr:carboxypeptidase regulatory-like domain-containing protein [Candidatus Schekmanbacteria bacterium]
MKWYKSRKLTMGALFLGMAGLFLPPSLQAQTTVEMGYGQAVSGVIAAGDLTLSSGQLYDEYSFNGQQGTKILVNMSSLDLDTVLWVTDENRKALAVDDDSGQGTGSVISNYTLPKTGKYYIWATTHSNGETGEYALSLNKQPVIGTFASLADKQTIDGILGTGDVQLSGGQYLDAYTIAADAKTSILVTMQSGDFDTYLWLTDSNGKVVTIGNDGQDSTNSQISFVPKQKGNYKLWASSNFPQETGSYSVTVESINLTAPLALSPIMESIQPIGNGQTIDGELSAGFAQLNTGQLVDVYSFNGIANQLVDIGMETAEFDNYLRVYDVEGKLIKMTDGNSIAGLTIPKSGSYLIWASSVFPGNTGAYVLSFNKTDAISGNLSGKIVDTCSGAIIPGANVVTAANFYFTSSNNDGAYSLTDIAPATYSIKVTADGYLDANTSTVLSGSQSLNLDIRMMPAGKVDTDNDNVPDECDNCIMAANSSQTDTDGDGYGNACDGDLNNDGKINAIDLGLFKKYFTSQNLVADFDASGRVNTLDLGLFKILVTKRKPGPSAFVK